jgi:hypothetical protein
MKMKRKINQMRTIIKIKIKIKSEDTHSFFFLANMYLDATREKRKGKEKT